MSNYSFSVFPRFCLLVNKHDADGKRVQIGDGSENENRFHGEQVSNWIKTENKIQT